VLDQAFAHVELLLEHDFHHKVVEGTRTCVTDVAQIVLNKSRFFPLVTAGQVQLDRDLTEAGIDAEV